MHNYILVDVLEAYEGSGGTMLDGYSVKYSNPKFVGHNYMIGCYTCEHTRIIKEETFDKMVGLGLIET